MTTPSQAQEKALERTVSVSATGSVAAAPDTARILTGVASEAVTARDTLCQFPGCTACRCDAHHVVHWAEGGATALDNLMLLCRRHHRLVHEGGYTVRRDVDGTSTFVRPNGWPVEVVPPPAPWESDKAEGPKLKAQPDGIMPCWDGTPFNVGFVIDALRGHEPLPPRVVGRS